MTSLVTGGAGFIGSHVARELIALGHRVVILDDLSGGFRENLPDEAEFIHGSITDVALLGAAFEKHKFDYVYHLAAYAAEGLSHFIRHFNYQNNLIGSVNLINESIRHKVKCFVFTSSIAVYGKGQVPMHEAMTPMPEDPYGISKFAVELDLKSAHEQFGLNYIVFRPHNVYGAYQNISDKYRNVVGIFMNQLLQGNKLTIFGDGSQRRAFTHIGDVAPHIARSVHIAGAFNNIFNIGADKSYSVNELANAVMKAMGISTDIIFLDARYEVDHAYSDHRRAEKIFGSTDTVSLEEGLASMADWVKKNGPRKSTEFANIEITEKLPPSWKI